MNSRFSVLILLIFSLSSVSFSQDSLSFDLNFDVNTVYEPLSISKERLTASKTLMDLNSYYKASWVKEYISVQISATCGGLRRTAKSKNHTLTEEQKEIMNMVNVGTGIEVNVQYLPDNTLSHNDIKTHNFTFIVNPETEAKFPGGEDQLTNYFQEHVMDKVSKSSFTQYNLTAVKFTINKDGKLSDVHVFQSSNDEMVDNLLLETVCNMPKWKPAYYSNGTKVKQEFVFTIGDHNSCVINLLNIRRDSTHLALK